MLKIEGKMQRAFKEFERFVPVIDEETERGCDVYIDDETDQVLKPNALQKMNGLNAFVVAWEDGNGLDDDQCREAARLVRAGIESCEIPVVNC